MNIVPKLDAQAAPQANKPSESPRMTAQQRRRRNLLLSALLLVALPSLAATLYYSFVAAKQYAVEVRFAIRGIDQAAASSE